MWEVGLLCLFFEKEFVNTRLHTNIVPFSIPPMWNGDLISSFTSDPLPAGLTINTKTGVIYGTPAVITISQDYSITATDITGFVISTTVTLQVVQIQLTYPSSPIFYDSNAGVPFDLINPLLVPIQGFDRFSISPPLPSGFQFDTSTGIISGVNNNPLNNRQYFITGNNKGGGVASTTLTLTIIPIDPQSLSYGSATLTFFVGMYASFSPVSLGYIENFSFTGNLPNGINLNLANGVISGSVASALYDPIDIVITASNTFGRYTSTVLTIASKVPSFQYPTRTLRFLVGTFSIFSPILTGSEGCQFSVFPPLPNGISLNSVNGDVYGSATQIISFSIYTVSCTLNGKDISDTVSVIVSNLPPSKLVYPDTIISFTVNTPIANVIPTVNGLDLTFSVDQPLPSGLHLDLLTGSVYGTPILQQSAQTYTITATNDAGSISTGLVILVLPPPPSNLRYPVTSVFIVDVEIQTMVPMYIGNVDSCILNFLKVTTYLPPGLSFDPNTGVITGIPSVRAPPQQFTVTCTNTGGSVTSPVKSFNSFSFCGK